MIFAQFFQNSTGYDAKTHTFSEANVKPIEMCGSDSVLLLDGRGRTHSWARKAAEVGRSRGAIGFTIHKGSSFIDNVKIVSYIAINKDNK